MSMGRGGPRGGLCLALLCLGLIAAGCGGSSSSSTPSSSTATDPSGGTEPSAQFLKPKGKNTIAKFGREASVEEREAASEVVTESLEAREQAEFDVQCETLSSKAIKEIPGAKSRQDCPKALKEFAEPLSGSKEARKDTLTGPIAAMRVKGNASFALYHGNDGKDYAVPLEKEGGSWKVASVQNTEI